MVIRVQEESITTKGLETRRKRSPRWRRSGEFMEHCGPVSYCPGDLEALTSPDELINTQRAVVAIVQTFPIFVGMSSMASCSQVAYCLILSMWILSSQE